MNEKARAFVKKLLEEGKRYDDVRRELISNGHSTDGFEEEYPELQKELGIKEPPPTKVSPHAKVTGGYTTVSEHDSIAPRKSHLFSNIIKIVVGILIIAIGVAVLSGYGNTLKNMLFSNQVGDLQEGLTADDLTHETTLKGFQLSANRYHSRMTDFLGLCDSIGLNKEIYRCSGNAEQYAIEVPLSNGTYYCVDSVGFADFVLVSYEESLECVKE